MSAQQQLQALQAWVEQAALGELRIDQVERELFGRLRVKLLNCEEFANLAETRWFARRRQVEHNHERPHSSLDYHNSWHRNRGHSRAMGRG